ncbi:helix-turn-helix transcriptional regulator [Enterobacteriaceae bacterium BIT-l23]|nr:helix-turn-helix transcriptional regulator [Enterobacteriaceae bacterium BIT-l23]
MMERDLGLAGYNPDSRRDPAVAFHIRVQESDREIPFHHHRKGQLILALHGGITCEVAQAMWMVPPTSAVWIPGGMPHSNRATASARLCFLFIEPGAVLMPDRCCTLRISPLVRELILALARRPMEQLEEEATRRLIQVLFDELPGQPEQQFCLPVSEHPRIRSMVASMVQEPGSRRTLAEWATELAMSERSLARLVLRETGLSFRRWRQQLQLIQALRLLIGGQTVQQVAGALGYDSTTAFITMFKKGLGQTPGRYLASMYPE